MQKEYLYDYGSLSLAIATTTGVHLSVFLCILAGALLSLRSAAPKGLLNHFSHIALSLLAGWVLIASTTNVDAIGTVTHHLPAWLDLKLVGFLSGVVGLVLIDKIYQGCKSIDLGEKISRALDTLLSKLTGG